MTFGLPNCTYDLPPGLTRPSSVYTLINLGVVVFSVFFSIPGMEKSQIFFLSLLWKTSYGK